MDSSNPQGTSLTVGQAANAFLGMMDGGEPPQEQVQDQTDEQELVASESESEESGEEVQEEEQRFVVKAAGEEREVTLQELIEGYQKGTDYHKKTNQLAEQRKAVEAEKTAIEQAKQARDAYSQRLQAMDNFLSQQMRGEDIESLKETDPIAYAVKVAERTQQEKQVQQIRAEQQRIAREQQQSARHTWRSILLRRLRGLRKQFLTMPTPKRVRRFGLNFVALQSQSGIQIPSWLTQRTLVLY